MACVALIKAGREEEARELREQITGKQAEALEKIASASGKDTPREESS